MQLYEAETIYLELKNGPVRYNESLHCPQILMHMSDLDKGTMSSFCVAIRISESTFYAWLKKHEVFLECYALGKMFSRENWEAMGRKLLTEITPIGETSHNFEYWRLIGWSRFGVGKNSRIRLDIDPYAKPNEHYAQLLDQASKGDFTAGEIKQLMEAINVGLNTHQVFELQKEIDQLKKDLAIMSDNAHGHNTITNK